MKKIKGFLPAFILLLSVLTASAQEAGRPFIRNFPPSEYRASSQNWAVTQDSRGIMYFANTDGLLEYDGINWRLIKKLPVLRSFAIDSSGRIYVGLENDIGYLEPDQYGTYQFTSLKSKMPEIQRDNTPVYYLYILRDQVIFFTQTKIFIYKNDQIEVFNYENGIGSPNLVYDRIYFRERGKGISFLEKNSLKFIQGSEIFANVPIDFMLPYKQNEILIATDDMGILIYSPEGPEFSKPFGFEEVNNYLNKYIGWSGTVLSNGNIAMGTLTGGIIITDPDGKIISRFDKSNGLQDNTIYALHSDWNQQLWAVMENGISLIPVNLPFRIFTEQDGLNGYPVCAAFFKDQFYVGTSQHLYIRNKLGFFEPIAGTEGQSRTLLEVNNTLLFAGYRGFFEIRDNQAIPIVQDENIQATSYCTLKEHPGNLLAVSGNYGLYLMEYKDAAWKSKHLLQGFNPSASLVVEGSDGNFWNSTWISDLYKLRINQALDSVTYLKYTSDQGLPSDYAGPLSLNSGKVVFGTEKGIYRYREDIDRFEPHPDFSMLTGKILGLQQLNNGDIWFEELIADGNYEKGFLKPGIGGYIPYKAPFYKFFDENWSGGAISTYTLPDSTMYIAASTGLLQYNPSKRLTIDLPYNTLIRKIFSKSTLLYGGADINGQSPGAMKGGDIPYKANDIIFEFASTFYEDPEKTVYSHRLIGTDTTWSAWEKDHKKEFSNLWEGSYTFEVKSKNLYQVVGNTASYSFRILPPWYRTWWAYAGYVIIFVLLIYVLVYYRTRKLKERSRELERTVEQRTAQIQEQKNNVEQLSRIGRDITSSLSIENITHTIYENVNNLMDASIFSIGIYKPEKKVLEFPAIIENNQVLPPYSVALDEEGHLTAWCFNNRKDVIINDYTLEYSKYISRSVAPVTSKNPESVLCIPMWNKEKVIGVITAQSFSKNAYSDFHLNMLRNLATYSAIALENADAYQQLATLLSDLTAAQERLVTQSKLAALGELTAGIAHEIQNPLNFVNNFAEVSIELIDEMKRESSVKGRRSEVGGQQSSDEILNDIKNNLDKILHHGKRADSIVKSMLQHSRSRSGVKEPTDINVLADEFLRLAFHGLRAKDKSFNATLKTDFDDSIGKINIAPQDIGRVILNLLTNAFYAVQVRYVETQHAASLQNASTALAPYLPTVTVSTKKLSNKIEIKISDNGTGIPVQVMDKIFQPFFTTKPAGQGTGLGLSLSYDIITKGHDGELKVETTQGQGSTFTIQLPV